MHGPKLPMTLWFWAAYLMATHSNGISAFQLWRQLGIGSYKTAWLMCAKLRRAMVNPERSPLSGLVELDDASIPYHTKAEPPTGSEGRSLQGKMLIAGAVEVVGTGPGRVRLSAIKDCSATSLHAFIAANIAPGTVAKTDAWRSYKHAPGVNHQPEVIRPRLAHTVLPWIHRVFANLKTWALGVYHSFRREHLQSYLDEFVFRFNRRRTRHAAFRTLLGISTRIPPATYKMLISQEAQG